MRYSDVKEDDVGRIAGADAGFVFDADGQSVNCLRTVRIQLGLFVSEESATGAEDVQSFGQERSLGSAGKASADDTENDAVDLRDVPEGRTAYRRYGQYKLLHSEV